MKIVYISNSIIPSRTANSVHVMKMAQAFSNNGLDTTLIVRYGNDDTQQIVSDYKFYGVDDNFSIIKLPWINRIGSLTYSVLSLLKVIKIKPDLVYGRCLIGVYLASLFGFKTMYEAHSPFYNQNIFKRYVFKKLIKHKNFKKLVVISDALKDIFMQKEQVKKENIFVAHDGSDIVDLNEKVDLNFSRLQVGYIGHLYKGRGIDIIIEVSKILNDVDFHIVGGNIEDIDYWKSEVKHSNIIFHGHLAPSEVYKYRNSFDILLAPYQNKVAVSGGKGDTSKFMSPLKIFEYMSSKKAIVCSDLPVLREVLHENNSILVKHNDINQWIEAINKLNDIYLREKLAKNAYKDFINKYTWKKRAKEILDAI
ncbi:MAG: glycosyltransferase [Campylobacterota bacterium]|nr:glycosyltransferase [Campylobacterota bacterium]